MPVASEMRLQRCKLPLSTISSAYTKVYIEGTITFSFFFKRSKKKFNLVLNRLNQHTKIVSDYYDELEKLEYAFCFAR